jgi:hypothetical protein
MLQSADINFTLLVPALLVFIALLLHCLFYRGLRLTLTFFGSAFLHTLIKELTHVYMENKFAFVLRPYWVLGARFKIFGLPLVIYMGWAITFYLSWYLAERILKRIGYFSDRIFPTIVWSLLIAGAISYCVETTAIIAGWWLWTSPDPRFKDFLVVPFSAIQAWPAQTAQFLLIFFLSECSKYRAGWWRVFLYTLIVGMFIFLSIDYSFMNFWRNTPIVFDIVRISITILLMFFYSTQLQFIRLNPPATERKKDTFFYDAFPLFALGLILFTCIIMDTLVLKNQVLLISIFPLAMFAMLSIKKIPLLVILILVSFSLIYGGHRLYILCIPTIIFLFFVGYAKLYKKVKNG